MYANGQIQLVMDQFENTARKMDVYIPGNMERAERVQIVKPDGRITRRFQNNNYYNNGEVNKAFLFFLNGYSFGKAAH